MIRNISYNDKTIRSEIDGLIGRQYRLSERIRLKGNGSPRFIIDQASPAIIEILNLDNNLNYCNIELRPGGLLISFRALLDTHAWIIPYYSLNIFKSQQLLSLYSGGDFIKLRYSNATKGKSLFIQKLLGLRAGAIESGLRGYQM